MKRAKVEFSSSGESGNIFFVIELAGQALIKQRRINDFNEMRDKVFASQSYEQALAAVREYVDLVDKDGRF